MNKVRNGLREAEEESGLPRARIKRSRFSWLIWGFPVAAAIFFGVLLFEDYLDKSRSVTVDFKNVDGVDDQGNTQVRCRGAAVGTVKHVTLTKNHDWAELTISFRRGQENLARSGALFWVVRPQVGAGMVRGLETVMSGAYVQVRPGDGPRTNHFIGAEEPPPEELATPALDIDLLAPDLSSLQERSPILYRGIQIGEITTFQLGSNARDVLIHARVRSEYAPLVRMNTIFWNAGGVDVHFGLIHGLDVRAESAKALVSGAVQMATPDDYGPPVTNGAVFSLQAKEQEAWTKWDPSIPLQLPPVARQTPSVRSQQLPNTSFRR